MLEKVDHFFDVLISAEMKNFHKPLGKLKNLQRFQTSDLQKRVHFLRFFPKVTEGAQNSKNVPLSLKKIAKIAVLELGTKIVPS